MHQTRRYACFVSVHVVSTDNLVLLKAASLVVEVSGPTHLLSDELPSEMLDGIEEWLNATHPAVRNFVLGGVAI